MGAGSARRAARWCGAHSKPRSSTSILRFASFRFSGESSPWRPSPLRSWYALSSQRSRNTCDSGFFDGGRFRAGAIELGGGLGGRTNGVAPVGGFRPFQAHGNSSSDEPACGTAGAVARRGFGARSAAVSAAIDRASRQRGFWSPRRPGAASGRAPAWRPPCFGGGGSARRVAFARATRTPALPERSARTLAGLIRSAGAWRSSRSGWPASSAPAWRIVAGPRDRAGFLPSARAMAAVRKERAFLAAVRANDETKVREALATMPPLGFATTDKALRSPLATARTR